MINIKEPRIEKNIFDNNYFEYIKNYFKNHDVVKKDEYHFYGSKRIDTFNDEVLKKAHEDLLPKARQMFESETLLPTYAVFSEYSGKQAYLDQHLDIGPCTYTIDLCLYQNSQWGLFIEGKEYFFSENEGIVFYPNHQLHWRGEFPDPDKNKVAIILFSYVEPDHDWWKIPEKLKPMLRNKVIPT